MIVVKEKNSDSVMYPYFCTIKMCGSNVNPEEYLNFIELKFDMGEIRNDSTGNFTWNYPVNTTFVKEHWDEMFDTYIWNVTKREHNMTMPLIDFSILKLWDDNMTMTYQATFTDPYMLGLLMKKSDKLYIHLKYDLLDVKGYFRKPYRYLDGMVTGNKTLTRMWYEKCKQDAQKDLSATNPYPKTTNREKLYVYKRIPLQFDFRNEQMWYMRQLAIKLYYYICGIVFLQFFVLLWRNVGLIPVWTMIEYMQLVAFIPLYNFRMIPYLYDAFKPFLVSHLVLTNETFLLKEMEDDYFNQNYRYYWLNVAKLGQALALIAVGFVWVCIVNIIMFILSKCLSKDSRAGKWVHLNLS